MKNLKILNPASKYRAGGKERRNEKRKEKRPEMEPEREEEEVDFLLSLPAASDTNIYTLWDFRF